MLKLRWNSLVPHLHFEPNDWVKSQLGILCCTNNLKAYKTLEWLGTCASVLSIFYDAYDTTRYNKS